MATYDATLSLLPVGLVQTWASVERGYWYAGSPELMQQDFMQILRWMRVVGDTIFTIGVVALVSFIVRLATGGSVRRGESWSPESGGAPAAAE